MEQQPQQLHITDFDYTLPDERIARYPLPERDLSKLLVFDKGALRTSVYRNLHEELPGDTALVFNQTRVIPARIHLFLESGRAIEVFCLEPIGDHADWSVALAQTGEANWRCMVGGAKKWKSGIARAVVTQDDQQWELRAEKGERQDDTFAIHFSWTLATASFAEMLERIGQMPIPPYLKREAEQSDRNRYQTIYAQEEGSVAAPTAGLHFTEALLDTLKQQGVEQRYLTLHVGAGTFKPVSAEALKDHTMHIELIEVSEALLRWLIETEDRIIPVGTTSMRTLESLFGLGMLVLQNPVLEEKDLIVGQWDAYQWPSTTSRKEALLALLNWLEERGMTKLMARTQLMIAPGYRFRVCAGLITNFHQPKSTLILLVAALIGDEWRRLYQHALENDFRFLSYGDGCLLLP